MPPAATTETVRSARQRFFSHGELTEGLVAAPILRSWQRCAQQGLDISDPPRMEPISAPALRECRIEAEEANGDLAAFAEKSPLTIALDPIDGTKNFIRGIPFFAVLIALEEDGEITAGVMYAPAIKRSVVCSHRSGRFRQ